MQTVTYQLSIADLVDARSFDYNSRLFVKIMRLLPPVIAAGCLVLAAYFASQEDWEEVIILCVWAGLGVALTLWALVANRLLLPGAVRKQLARDAGLRSELTVAWDAEQVTFESRMGHSRWLWSDFYRWQESPGGFLIWRSDRMYNYLPKRSLTEAAQLDLRRVLAGVRGPSGRARAAN